MIDHINKNEYGHILTVEDPIEFVHTSQKCLINQREVHRDTHGFNEALRSALREDPDYILVGEMRDLETIRLALTAAETGHLVFATLHTSSAAKTIDRIIDVFPAGEKPMVRSMLSESLRAVISQSLLKKVGGGRIAAHEIMVGTPAIRNLIREDKVAQMYSSIQTGQHVRHADARPVPAGPGQARPGDQGSRRANTPRTSGCSMMQCRHVRCRTSARRCPRTDRSSAMSSIDFTSFLKLMAHKKASDLFITAGVPPSMKVQRQASSPITQNPLTPQQSRDLVLNVMTPVAARGVREDPRVQLRDRRVRRRPLPRQLLLPAQPGRHGAAPDRDQASRPSRS